MKVAYLRKLCWKVAGNALQRLILGRFDILLPIDYPWNPPKMLFVLEGYDHKRENFNPNFHGDGTGQSPYPIDTNNTVADKQCKFVSRFSVHGTAAAQKRSGNPAYLPCYPCLSAFKP